MRRKRPALVENFLDCAVKRRSGQRCRPRPARPLPKEDLIGVALHIRGLIGMDAQAVADELLEYGLVPLALRDASRKERERARTIEPNLSTFETQRSGALDRIGKPEATQLAALFRLGAPLGKALDVRLMDCFVENAFELAAIVGKGEPCLVRHRLR